MLKRLSLLLALLLAGASGAVAKSSSSVTDRPQLVVLISIDQFRADYLTRFSDLYLPPGDNRKPGGFRFLMERGAWYPDCRYAHYRTVTGVGHSILSTGAQPAVSGIVGNDWFDRATAKSVYCVDDPAVKLVGPPADTKLKAMSPVNQLVTTLGDELELATGGRSRTISVSLKDRAAILLAGHAADEVYWFDDASKRWITSTFYAKDGKLPAWIDVWNAKRLPTSATGVWKPSVPAEAMQRATIKPTDKREFEYKLTPANWATSPEGNRYTLSTAEEAVRANELGRDAIPDLLTINLAGNDYVGHKWGPDSPEALDISVQTDRRLSEFFATLAKTVPGGLSRVTVALTADHGVCAVPEVLTQEGVPGGRVVAAGLRTLAEKTLDDMFGADDWVNSIANGEIYFSAATLAKHPDITREALESAVCRAVRQFSHVYAAYGRSEVLAGQLPSTPLGKRLANNYHPLRSGDVLLILDPLWLPGALPIGTGSTHGSPWTYDTHVPLLTAGFGIEPGVYAAAVEPAMLAPTLSHVLKIARPSGADEPLLPGLQGVR
jgi:predicted AlkP superfamily pyrophosphatase or phosphodiesterase